ncbi:MAG: hypothetical protein N3A66_02375, partial [Planctomycetota bacterium]|nr:hypothetical protein [Planctomycetota bacterium]
MAGDRDLPRLRPEVEIIAGPASSDGAPTWLIADRLRASYFTATWGQGEILRRLRQRLSLAELMGELRRTTALRPTPEQILALCETACRAGLCASAPTSKSPPAASWWSKVMRLFVWRITLFHPHEFLSRTLPQARCLLSWPALFAGGALSLCGLAAVLQRLDLYAATFVGYLQGEGLIWYALAMTAVKLCHEMAHAYAAEAAGCRVRAMGITLICLWPIPFCDVTDLWRVPSRRKRLGVNLAGVAMECGLAGLALFVWSLSEAGAVNSIAFILSSTALFSTLAVNLNPLMRFDGYYALSDLLNIPNLRLRAAAALRWLIARFCLGCSWPRPEPGMSAIGFAGLAIFAAASAAYRLLFAAALAALAAEGLGGNRALAAGGAALAMASSAAGEARNLWAISRRQQEKARRLLALSALALALLFIPLPRSQRLPAVALGPPLQKIYAPYAGEAREVRGHQGQRVKAGDTLVVIVNAAQESEQRWQEWECQICEVEFRRIAAGSAGRENLKAKERERERLEAEKQRLAALAAAGHLTAAQAGEIVAWDETLAPGAHRGREEILGIVAGDGAEQIRIYMPEETRPFVGPGAEVFFATAAQPTPIVGRISRLLPGRADSLDEMSALLAAAGRLPVKDRSVGSLSLIHI